ncbi:zinc ribbon domain-containing protein [Clostridium sp.]|jgi:uncharacterized protein|uniref:zinc ribbon domain-containing protein n=1 Tax=Clostridium sp. TaxID=1506 RepID=UPI003A5C1932
MLDLLIKIQSNRQIIEDTKKESKNNKIINEIKEIKRQFESEKKVYVELNNKLKNLKEEINNIEDNVKIIREEIKKDESKLYSNMKYDLKFIEGLQKSIEVKKQEVADMEDRSLELMYNEEELSNKRDMSKTKLVKLRDDFYKYKEIYNNSIIESRKKVEQAKQNIADTEKLIPKDLLDEFYTICDIKGSGAAKVSNGVCEGCRMKVSAITLDDIKKNKKIVYCDNCGRIIHCN